MKLLSLFAITASAFILTACGTTPPQGLIYTGYELPRAYRASTPSEVKTSKDDKVVSGESCAKGVLGLFAFGDASYGAASKNALGANDGVLYDVKSDTDHFSFLFLYQEYCTRVTGKIGQLQ